MGGFDKIDFASITNNNSEKEEDTMAARRKKKVKLNISRKKLGIILAVVLVLFVGIGLPAYATYQSGLKTYRQAKLVSNALKVQNIALASDEIKKTRKSLEETQGNMRFLLPLKFIPVINWYYNDADHLLNASAYMLESGQIVTDSLKPYADVLGLKGEGTYSGGSAEDRIKTAVLSIGKITPQIDTLADLLVKARTEVDAVSPNHYPELIFGKNIKSQLTTLQTATDQGATFIDEARPLVKVLPALLGEKEAKKYLVLFQNDKELRPTGGFITAYAIFTVDKGVIKLEKSEDIYALDNSIPNKKRAPAPIQKYLKVPTYNLRDSNINPDFIESMKTFTSMYDTARAKVEVDGIIALDTSVLVSTIKILDDQVTAGGITFNTKTDERCDCPQVIYELEDNISRPVNYIKAERKGLLGDLLQAIMAKALSSSPKIYWGPLMQSMITQSAEKHVLFYLFDENAQKGIESLNAAGRIRDTKGDYLHINETSFSGAKVNIFIREEVENSYEVEKDGSIIKTVTINHKNPYPPSDCNLERGGLCLNAEYKNWFRIYVPKGSELLESKGSQVKITPYDELGKTVFEGFLTVRPKGISKFSISYKLPFKADKTPLPVLIQKQPGTYGYAYSNVVNGNIIDTYDLLTDKEFELNIR